MNKLNSFAKQFVAIIKGDDAEAMAAKVWRQADSALKVQIASLTGDTIKFEDEVSNAQKALDKAKVNFGKEISDRTAYVEALISAKNVLTLAEEKLNNHKETLAFLQESYDSLSKE